MSNNTELQEIAAEVHRLAALINASDLTLFPTYGAIRECFDFHRNITIDSRGYNYLDIERGIILHRKIYKTLDELLYAVFSDITRILSIKYQREFRADNQDGRRLQFPHQIELISTISPAWATRKAEEHALIPKSRPFDDFANFRLRANKEVGWTKACEIYPLPTPNEA